MSPAGSYPATGAVQDHEVFSYSHPQRESHGGPGNITGSKVRVQAKADRRSRGEIACAECRRLKIRCDRIVPCTTCVKRGCGALCPNGTIPPGEGSRFVLAATDHLHRKLARLEGRMRSLEDALAIVQANTSDRPHPLLVTPLEEVDDEPRFKPIQEDRFEDRSDSPADLVDGLGTLIMDERGSSRFFGPTGGSESLLVKAKELEVRASGSSSRTLLQELDPSYLPPEINHYYQAFPFPPTGFRASPVQSMIESFLPSVERAIALCGTFLEHLSWMFNIVTRQHVVGELIPAVYKQSSDTYGPHDLALLLIVLGIGSLVDLTLEPYNLEAQHYYRLTRAAMSLQPVLAEQSMVTIKVLHLMSIYNGMSGKESNLEQSYTLLDLAGQVALRIGFHIDPSMWGIEGREAYDRRVYFWNLMAGVTWQSLVTGRPPALLISYVNCRIPSAEDESRYQAGEVPLGFGIWGFKASADCLIPVVRATLAAKPPEYSAVLDLDQKIRSFASPKPDDAKDERIAISMRNFVRAHYQDLILLFLHRGFFAQAMSENPQDPLRSKYGHSVTAAYASSCTVLSDIRGQFSKKPLLCGRIWRMWSYAFSAAIVVGTIAIRGSHLNLQPPAFHEFELTCETFRQAAEISNRAARAMPILQIMLEKAVQARHPHLRTQMPSDGSAEDELSIFGGQTRVYTQSAEAACSPPPNPAPSLPPQHDDDTCPPPMEPMHHDWQQPVYACASRGNQPNQPSHVESLGVPLKTFADLSGGWDGLFHEAPAPSYASQTAHNTHAYQQPVGEGGMLDDRWSSFMHHYSILSTPEYEPQA